MKIVTVVFLSLIASSFAHAQQLGDLISKYYDSETTGPKPDLIQIINIDHQVEALDLSQVDVPTVTVAWLKNKRKQLRANGKSDWVGDTQIPDALYMAGPPSKWIEYLSKEMRDPTKFNCVSGDKAANCKASQEKGGELDPLITEVGYRASRDPKLSTADIQKLKDLFYSYYKNLSLKTDETEWQISPGGILQLAAGLGDPRAIQKAMDLSSAYLKGEHGSTAETNLQQAMFALNSFYDANRSDPIRAHSPLNEKVVALLSHALMAKSVPEYIKKKVRESVNRPDEYHPPLNALNPPAK